MTTHTAITDYYAGATLDAGSLLCHRTTDATIYTASATSELNAGGGVYSAVFANVAAGTYRLKLIADGEVVASRIVRFAGTDGETVETTVVELDSAVRVTLASAQPDYAPAKAADVKAQVLDVLTTDTFAELNAPPAATSSLKDKLTWLFMWARNKATETSEQRKLYADDGTTVVSTETVGDDGATFTKGKSA